MAAIIAPDPIDPAALLAGFSRAGAVASFIGHVREDDGVTALHLEHYPAMATAALSALEAQARARWGLQDVLLVHRVGHLSVGDPIVLVATAAPHRAPALEACHWLIDRLKTDIPFWKKELLDGAERWVE